MKEKQTSSMEEQEWIKNMMCFQARCRGFLIRKELQSVQVEFEDIVKNLEGSLEHLTWRGQFIPKPHFTDRVSTLFRYLQPNIQTRGHPKDPVKLKEGTEECKRSHLDCAVLVAEKDEPSDSGTRQTSTPQESDREAEGTEECQKSHLDCAEKDEVAEKDEEPSDRGTRQTSTPQEGNRETKELQTETAGDSSCIGYSSLLEKSHQTHTLLKDVANSPESLRQYRRTLAMELLWIQQAIASRKKYLSLKQKMEAA